MEDAYSSNMSDLSSVGKNDPSTDLQNQHATGGNTILISYHFLLTFLLYKSFSEKGVRTPFRKTQVPNSEIRDRVLFPSAILEGQPSSARSRE